jgi:acetyl-CoA/propionyl-CoA carboxylase biotin carboxyl carrier protein
LQVEHTVTEQTTGIDLVVEQLRIADGHRLSLTQTPTPLGHAFEFRINAEDVGRGFLPTPGRLQTFAPPSGPGVRVDSGVQSGSSVPGNYDSLMAKLIITGATRQQAIDRARRALKEFKIDGLASVLPFHRAVMAHPDFVSETAFKVHTRWIETDFVNDLSAAARVEPLPEVSLLRSVIEIDGRRVSLGLPAELLRGLQSLPGAAHMGSLSTEKTDASTAEQDPSAVPAPISGNLLSWKVAEGDAVSEGDVIAVMEAMKMEMQVIAPCSGRINLLAAAGSYQAAGACIARVVVGKES